MIEFLNANEGVIAIIGVIVSIIIAIIGFYINKNITKISQNQNVKNNSKGLQGGGDVIDKSINFDK
ncbi:MAG: hypothetical protein KAR57_06255 [Bacteroidales bacterium]|nr:hypothetical protein [Bacteroidales bacterium]